MYRLPLFPLPSVLTPGATMPLHIFEPRYRQMIAHCVENDNRFGLLYHDPDRSGPYDVTAGQVGCVAVIVQFNPLSDGRSQVLVRGAERFRVEREVQSTAMYFEGMVTQYVDEDEEPGALYEHTRNSVALFHQVLEHISSEPQPLPELDEKEPLSFQLARWIRIDPTWQQELLELRTEEGRLTKIDELLHTTLTL